MFVTSLLVLALAATGLADVPAGYKKVYLTSKVDAKFVIVPKAAKSGSTIVVYVSQPPAPARTAEIPILTLFLFRSQTRNDKPEQQWYVKDGSTKIQLADSTLCLDGGAKSEQFTVRV